jgi:hypothetical protein
MSLVKSWLRQLTLGMVHDGAEFKWRFPEMEVTQVTMLVSLLKPLKDLDDLGYPYLRKPSKLRELISQAS